MNEQKRALILLLIMVVVAMIISATAIGLLYRTAFREERARLVETAQSQARLMEAIAHFDAAYNSHYSGGTRAATLSQIREAHANYRGFGKTGEFALAERQGDQIVFLLKHRHGTLDQQEPILFQSRLAEPMRLALAGKSGTIIGLDYRGETVLAAFEPVKFLNFGIVAKIDLSEIRSPFIQTGGWIILIATLAITIGAYGFTRITGPWIQKLQMSERKIRRLNETLEKRVVQRTKELAFANQEMEAFTYSVSHDLRGPLRTMEGFSRILLEDYANDLPEQATHQLRRIQAGSLRMSQLIDDLLRLSRVVRGELQITTINLSSVAQTIAEQLQEEFPERSFQWQIASNLMAQGDLRLVTIVLTNLLANAVKFSVGETPTQIKVGSIVHEGQQTFFVQDNGAGFDMQYASKLFMPFQRLHKVEEFEGNGIGLATVHRIIHRHAGKIWAEARKGAGATFYFTLMLAEDMG